MVTAHVNAKDDRWRCRVRPTARGCQHQLIVRMDATAPGLLSKRRQYLEVPIARDHQLAVSETMEGEVSRELVGDETAERLSSPNCFDVTVAENGEIRAMPPVGDQSPAVSVEDSEQAGSVVGGISPRRLHHAIFILIRTPATLDWANPTAETQH